MSILPGSTTRYTDDELNEFKIHIEQKIENTRQQIQSIVERIENISDMTDNDGDRMDDTSNMQNLEMLYAMVGRQKKHVRDLENALIRVHNKNYGVCVATGELIDKRRLMAVPTTTKSLEAKNAEKNPVKKEVSAESKSEKKVRKSPGSFSRVIKRSGGSSDLAKKKSSPVMGVEDEYDAQEDFDINAILDDIESEE